MIPVAIFSEKYMRTHPLGALTKSVFFSPTTHGTLSFLHRRQGSLPSHRDILMRQRAQAFCTLRPERLFVWYCVAPGVTASGDPWREDELIGSE